MTVCIQGTNDSCSKSKLSTEEMGYISERKTISYLREFIQESKKQRRAPLIHRGYYIRSRAILDTISKIIQETCINSIINVGCGYDPLYFHLTGEKRNFDKHVDIDYPELITNKVRIIKGKSLKRYFSNEDYRKAGEEEEIVGEKYCAIGCDLFDLNRLKQRLFEDVKLNPDQGTLILAECSLTYMPVEKVDLLMGFFSAEFSNATILIYEQIQSPVINESSDAFFNQMMSHFNKIQSPLLNINQYKYLQDIDERLESNGFNSQISSIDLGSYWYHVLPPTERDRVCSLELFDEYEEFDIKLNHYFICIATNKVEYRFVNEFNRWGKDQEMIIDTDETLEISLKATEVVNDSIKMWANTLNWQNGEIVSCGGYGQDTDNSVRRFDYVCSLTKDGSDVVSHLPQGLVHMASCDGGSHGIFIHGGRSSPKHISNQLLLFKDRKLSFLQIDGLPCRYRHTISRLNNSQLLIYGGLDATDNVFPAYLVNVNTNECVKLKFNIPERLITKMQRFSHQALLLNECLWIFGGRNSNDPNELFSAPFSIVLSFQYDTNGYVDANALVQVKFIDFYSSSLIKLPCRYSHICQRLDDSKVLIIGGVTLPALKTGLLLSPGIYNTLKFVILDINKLTWTVPSVKTDPNFLMNNTFVQSSCIPYENGYLLVGGGATCFSMGTVFDRPLLVNVSEKVNLYYDIHAESQKRTIKTCDISKLKDYDEPCLIEGTLAELSLADFQKQVSNDELVSYHLCKSKKLTFTPSRNYEFKVEPFDEFFKKIQAKGDEFYYLRTIGNNPRKEASNALMKYKFLLDYVTPLFEYFPQCHPSSAQYFSSILRIGSAGMHLWTHYDTMDNILIQLTGFKKVIMWAPKDVKNLYINGSSSTIPDMENITQEHSLIRNSEPYQVILKPGDVLVIPALWFHYVITDDSSPSMSLNIFWRSLPKTCYERKDLYGNQDLEVYNRIETFLNANMNDLNSLPQKFKQFYIDKTTDLLNK